MSQSRLNSDELGKKGEAHFVEICADAKLVCNRSEYDRTGWDFIVEARFPDEDVTGTLEERGKPLSCHVQVKTLWQKNDAIKMRLISAEHLAKEVKPSFVYVFKVNSAKEYVGAYLIHLMDDPLAKVLKRLRKEDIKGNPAPNKSTITMSASGDGIFLAPTGEALRDALYAACGPDTRAYTDKKTTQINTLGFEKRPYGLTLSMTVDSMEEMVDAFLGLKKTVQATDLKSSLTRFGLKKLIPEHSDSEATISIHPSAADTCTITVRNGPLSVPSVFKAKVYFPAIPGLAADQMKILIEAPLVQFVFKRSEWTIGLHPVRMTRT